MYNINSKKSQTRRKSPELKPSRELSYMDLKTITIQCAFMWISTCLFNKYFTVSLFVIDRFLKICQYKVLVRYGIHLKQLIISPLTENTQFSFFRRQMLLLDLTGISLLLLNAVSVRY